MKNVLDQCVTDRFAMYHGDTIDVARCLPDNSVDFSIFSPPFSSLYSYSASERDMGNSRNDDEFWGSFRFLIKEMARVMKPGRLVAAHVMALPTSKAMHGYIGLRDFPGDIIRAYEAEGFIYHSEIVIWKDPVTAMQRTKALGLLHKTIRSDSSMSRQGIPDKVVVMRKPGKNPDPIPHTHETFPVERWQRYASPVWCVVDGKDDEGFGIAKQDINPSDTLQHRSVREEQDERHIAPLQLEVIRRCILLWSNPNDWIWSPFGGIGSEGVVALEEGRRAILAELKGSYYRQAVANLKAASKEKQADLFSLLGEAGQ
jgi:DNA modification methylase